MTHTQPLQARKRRNEGASTQLSTRLPCACCPAWGWTPRHLVGPPSSHHCFRGETTSANTSSWLPHRGEHECNGEPRGAFPQWFYSPLLAELRHRHTRGSKASASEPDGPRRVLQGDLFPQCHRNLPRTTAASWGSMAPVNQQSCPLSHTGSETEPWAPRA